MFPEWLESGDVPIEKEMEQLEKRLKALREEPEKNSFKCPQCLRLLSPVVNYDILKLCFKCNKEKKLKDARSKMNDLIGGIVEDATPSGDVSWIDDKEMNIIMLKIKGKSGRKYELKEYEAPLHY